MYISVIIATVGRPSLSLSVSSVLEQDFPLDKIEIVVVNDSGTTLPVEPWQSSENVILLNTQKRERCFARNAGASVALGNYLLFLDDDDWLLPGALRAFLVAAEGDEPEWIYGGARFLDPKGEILVEHHPGFKGNGLVQLVGGDWIPLSAFIVKSTIFFEVGGFDPRFVVNENLDLCRKIALRWDAVSTPATVVALLRDQEKTTTNYELFNYYNFWSRDEIFTQPGAFGRMRHSIIGPYWGAKFVRSYLTCAWWNLQRGKWLNALSRGLCAMVGLIMFLRYVIRGEFWGGLLKHHRKQGVA